MNGKSLEFSFSIIINRVRLKLAREKNWFFFGLLFVVNEITHSSSSTSNTLRQYLIHVANNVSTQKFHHTHTHRHASHTERKKYTLYKLCHWCDCADKWVTLTEVSERKREWAHERARMRRFFICLTRAEFRSCINAGWKETHKASAADISRPSAVQLWCFVLLLNLCEQFYLLCEISS